MGKIGQKTSIAGSKLPTISVEQNATIVGNYGDVVELTKNHKLDSELNVAQETCVNAATTELTQQNTSHVQPVPMIDNGNRVPYVNLFKNNRMAHSNYKLEFKNNGGDKLKFGYDVIDSVEKTYGICLLGYVVSGKPPTAALVDLTRRWGPNVHFQTHDSGWITFTFPSIELREKILNIGNHMVYGHHLFLKEMPRCFRFREEDMATLPSWIQIFGLPPDCWTFDILSHVSSRIGVPIHMDMLTHERKRSKYARVLVEVDVHKPRLYDMLIELPIGDIEIRIVYEDFPKLCSVCKKMGHDSDHCKRQDLQQPNAPGRGRSRSVGGRNFQYRSKSKRLPSIVRHIATTTNTRDTAPEHVNEEKSAGADCTIAEKECELKDKGKQAVLETIPVFESTSYPTAEDGFTQVVNKKMKNRKKTKKHNNERAHDRDEALEKFLEDMNDDSSCDTEFTTGNNDRNAFRYFGKPEKGRQPTIASSSK